MTLQEALTQSDAPAAVVEESTRLVELKAVTREMGRGEAPAAIVDFVHRQLDQARAIYEDATPAPRTEAIARCEEFFRNVVT
jgi:hypothetical protein